MWVGSRVLQIPLTEVWELRSPGALGRLPDGIASGGGEPITVGLPAVDGAPQVGCGCLPPG
jgi:hypothetical protein